MSHNNRPLRPRVSPLRRFLHGVAHNAPFVVLACALATVAVAVWGLVGPASAGQGAAPQVSADGWITLHGQSRAAIIAAARQSPLFHVDRSGNGDYLHDLSRLGNPALVQGMPSPHGAVMSDFYVVPVLDAANNAIGAVVMVLNPARTAVMVQSIDTYTTPHPAGSVSRMTPSRATSIARANSAAAVVAGVKPQLVYFPINQAALDAGTLTWNAGGELPDDPIWLFSSGKGQAYVVGTDNSIHAASALPYAP